MDDLKAVMAARCKTKNEGKGSLKKKKYMTRGEREALEEEEEETKKNAALKIDLSTLENKTNTTTVFNDKNKIIPQNSNDDIHQKIPSPVTSKNIPNWSTEELHRRLRLVGQPIKLFGENENEKSIRLTKAQAETAGRGMDLESGHAIRNTFLKRSNEVISEDNMAVQPLSASDEEEDQKDSIHIETLIYKFFRRCLRKWAYDLATRPPLVKNSADGKQATKRLEQCKDYIRPLMKLCKKKQVPKTILTHLHTIVTCCKNGSFVYANDAYIALAIGNAAWPIGVTSVGIHERTAREKINSNKQAHVMNNELQRKYLTSVKRIISYCQSTRQDLPSSQRVS